MVGVNARNDRTSAREITIVCKSRTHIKKHVFIDSQQEGKEKERDIHLFLQGVMWRGGKKKIWGDRSGQKKSAKMTKERGKSVGEKKKGEKNVWLDDVQIVVEEKEGGRGSIVRGSQENVTRNWES